MRPRAGGSDMLSERSEANLLAIASRFLPCGFAQGLGRASAKAASHFGATTLPPAGAGLALGFGEGVHVALVNQGGAGVDEGRDGREGVFRPVDAERPGRVVVQVVELLQSEISHGVGLLRDG